MARPDDATDLTLAVLGPTTVRIHGAPVACGPRERALLTVLAFAHPRAVDVETVADALWDDARPRTYRQVVHNAVSGLRRALRPDAIVTEPGPAYRLGPGWTLDADAFAAARAAARRARAEGDHRAERVHLQRALGWCRGEAFAGLAEDVAVSGRRAAHLQAVLATEEDGVFAALDDGDAQAAVARAAELVAAEPYREVRWSLLALAAYRSDQRGASLATLARARRVLRNELGLEPGPSLVRLERMVLDDDRRLTARSSRVALGVVDGPTVTDDGEDESGASHGPHVSQSDDDADPASAIAWRREAARSTAETGLFEEAAALLAAAVDIATEAFGAADERTLRLQLDHAEQRRRAGDTRYGELLWRVHDQADEAGSETMVALATAALCKLGPTTEAGGPADRAIVAAVERVMARCDDVSARARCAGEATLFFSMKGEAERCRAYFDEALTLARQVDDPDLLISALGNAYLCLPHPDDLGQRTDLAIEMLVLAERLGGTDAILEALHFVFSVQLQNADPLLRTTLAREVTLANSVGSMARRWMAGYQHTCLRWLEGRLDDAEELASRTLDLAPVGRGRAVSTYRVAMLGIRDAQHREQELAEDMDAAVAENPGMPAWRTLAAWIAARRGDAARVCADADALDAGRGLPVDMAWSGATMLLGRAVALIGDVDRSRRVYDLIRPYAGQFTWMGSSTTGPYDLALAELALVLGEREAAAGHVADLARVIGRTGAVVFEPELARLRDALG